MTNSNVDMKDIGIGYLPNEYIIKLIYSLYDNEKAWIPHFSCGPPLELSRIPPWIPLIYVGWLTINIQTIKH